MTLLEAAPSEAELLAFVDQAVRGVQESGGEPRFVVAGPVAYERLQRAVAERFGRDVQHLEQVQWLTVVLDPGRGDRITVLPPPREAADGARLEHLDR